MLDEERLEAHVVFPAEFHDDILVVMPAGEAFEFREQNVASEINRLLRLVDEPDVTHLVIDFGKANYFGSLVIGAINALAMRIRAKGGSVAICNASKEMLNVLEIMNLGGDWMRFPSVRKALKELR